MPLPETWNVTDVSTLRLATVDKAPVPAQFEVLARWGGAPDDTAAPVKWVLAGCFTNVISFGTETLRIDTSGPGPAPADAISINTSTPGLMLVDTGAAQFAINTDADFNLFEQVTVDGQEMLEALTPRNAIDYDPAGPLSIVGGGSPDFTPRTTNVTVERSGPLCAVVRVEGSILDDSARALLDFTARLHFYAGSTQVRADFTVENNQPVVETVDGQPANAHNLGAVNSVYIGSLALNLRLRDPGAAALRVLTENDIDINDPASAIRLYQDSSGTGTWDNYTGDVGWPGFEAPAAPRLQAYCTLPGYEITGPGISPPETGDQALGWVSAGFGAAGPRLTAAVRDFWQNFPKAIEAEPDGTVSIDLFPNGEQFRHNFRVGEEKTHSILLDFGVGPMSGSTADRLATAFSHPLIGLASPAWYINSGALGEAPAADTAQWPLYEHYVNTAFDPNPDFDPDVDDPSFGNGTLLDAIDRYGFYGWQDYGDLPLDYEGFGPSHAGQMNLKYWYTFGMFVQLLRSGDVRWFNLGRAAAWHLADVDYLHIPDEGIQHWVHGAYFGHSQHDEPGNLNPNRNSNSPSVDLFFGVPDLLLAYHVTGEQRFADVAREGLEAMESLSQFSNFGDPYDWDSVLQRERANLLIAYMEGYRHTGDTRWLDDLNEVVATTADLSNKGWVTGPAAYGAAHPGGYLRMFMFNQILWTLGRYLDFCQEYGIADTIHVADALEAYGDFVLDFATDIYRPGRACHPYDVVFDGSDPSYPDINNWALVMADGLAYAYKHTGQTRFLDTAAMYYATGTIDPQWEGDPPVYIDTKGLVNALNWGLVYMNQAAK